MKLNHVLIQEAWGLRDLEIFFDEPSENYFKNSNVSVLVGENGTGKTSILRLISYAFFPEMREKQELYPYFHINYEINNVDFDIGALEIESNRIIRPARVIVSSFAVFEAFKVDFRNRIKENNFVAEYDGTEYYYCGPTVRRGISSLKEAIPTIVKSFYSSKYNNRFNESITYLMQVIGYNGFPSIEITMPRLNRNRIRHLDNEEILTLQKKLSIVKEEIKEKRYLNLGMGKYQITPQNVDENLLEMLLEIEDSKFFNKIFTDLFFNKEGNEVRFSNMSSGELTMFFRFFPLIDKICDNCIVLIDEPETHLHPRWIKNYINLIVKLFGDYKSHIIIATHSPLIASDVPKECIVGLKRIENNIIEQYHITEKTLGGETSDILEDVFNLDDYSGEFTKSKKEMIKKLLRESKVREALEIYDDLSSNSEKYRFFSEIENLFPDFGEE